MENSQIFNISGPYGVGKDTMLNAVLSMHGEKLHRVGTVTTRQVSEQSDPSYRSVNDSDFEQIITKGRWIINRQLDGKLAYATSIDEIEDEIRNGKVCVHSIFPGENGAEQLRRVFGARLCSIALLPTHGEEEAQIEELRRRMVERGRESMSRIEDKLAAQRTQIHFILENKVIETRDGELATFDKVIINDDLNMTVKEVANYFSDRFPQLK